MKFFIRYRVPTTDDGQTPTELLELTDDQVRQLYNSAQTTWFHENIIVRFPPACDPYTAGRIGHTYEMTFGQAYEKGLTNMLKYL